MTKRFLFYSPDSLDSSTINQHSTLYKLGAIPDAFMPVDRLNAYTSPVDVIYDEMPAGEIRRVTLEEACYDAAMQIYSRSDDVVLLWSGGIDSTLAAVNLLKYRPPHCKLTFAFNQLSVEEYPAFASFIRTQCDYRFLESNEDYRFATYLQPHQYLTSGNCADQLLGSRAFLQLGLDFNTPISECYNSPLVTGTLPKVLLDRDLSEDTISTIIQQAPIALTTVFDFFWYLNFRFKWTHVRWKMITFIDATVFQPSLVKRYNPFYNTISWQHWSIGNHYLKHEGTQESYKLPFKQEIVRATKDSSYLKKLKHPSFPAIRECRKSKSIFRLYEDGSVDCYDESN